MTYKKITFDKFLLRAKAKHGNTYDYSLAEKTYDAARSKITIICPIHGEFEQRAANHASGSGCKKCSTDIRKGKLRMSSEEFLNKAVLKHGGKYDYSKVGYENSRTKVTIICPDHGEFEQNPGHHLFGSGCPKCAKNYSVKRAKEKTSQNANLEVLAPVWGLPKTTQRNSL